MPNLASAPDPATALPICGGTEGRVKFGVGCGKEIVSIADLYRCATCDTPMHKGCLVAHFNWRDDMVPRPSNIERLMIAERRVAELEAERA